jgi:hypothetical protein
MNIDLQRKRLENRVASSRDGHKRVWEAKLARLNAAHAPVVEAPPVQATAKKKKGSKKKGKA